MTRTAVVWGVAAAAASAAEVGPVGRVPADVRERLALSPAYTQHVEAAGGIPVIASARVHPGALREAAWLIGTLTAHRPEVARAIGRSPVRFVVMAHDEFTTDVPEHSDLEPGEWWDRRARGLGATLERPAVREGGKGPTPSRMRPSTGRRGSRAGSVATARMTTSMGA